MNLATWAERNGVARDRQLVSCWPSCSVWRRVGRLILVDEPEGWHAITDRGMHGCRRPIRKPILIGRSRGRTAKYGPTEPVDKYVTEGSVPRFNRLHFFHWAARPVSPPIVVEHRSVLLKYVQRQAGPRTGR